MSIAMKNFSVEGKKAIVTGGSRGLGKGMAEGLMNAGAEVVLFATTPQITSLAQSYRDKGLKCHGISVDLGNREDRETAFDKAVNLLGGRLDILVNAAGIQRRHKSEEFPLEDWNEVIDINLTAVFALCQSAAKVMIPQKQGKIINIASLLSYFGGFTVPAYAASKGGIAQITKAFANEWAAYGINVNAIAPGYMETDMNIALINDEARSSEILARIPANRWGTAEDIAGLAVFLSSPASDYINGAIIPVDGGYLGR